MLVFPSPEQFVHHIGQAGRVFSPRLWKRLTDALVMIPSGGNSVKYAGDDFLNAGGAVATNVGGWSGYKTYEDTGGSILQLATSADGVLRFSTAATDNNECWLQSGYSAGTLGVISDTAGSDKMLAFECRIAVGQISDDYNVFVGLGEEALAAANTITDAGALADKDLIGFNVLEADGDALKFVWRKAGQAVQTLATVQVPVAATFYNLGFIYDPTAPSSRRITVYVDNVEQTTYGTAANIAAATFPDGEELAFLAGIKTGAAANKTLDIDSWAFAQVG